ncbi:MAG TPA: L,D-transpeptidase [Rhizomicrobium sp.]|nr:L,D-transpeptidase [Rhizomicrobium sp.]
MLRIRELGFVTAAAMVAMSGASLWQDLAPPRPAATIAAIVQPKVHPKNAVLAQVQQRIPLKVATVTKTVLAAPEAAAPKDAAPKDDASIPDEDTDHAGAERMSAAEMVAEDAELDKQAPDVAERLRGQVPPGLARYFDVFLYVSKANAGAWAQHMFIFHRADDGEFIYEKNIPVSTGRERYEKYFTSTPAGIFELDPDRFETMHHSHLWHGAPMAWAMFLNARYKGRQVGIALHSAGEHIADLGHRASGGCVRLPPEQAEILFHRFQAQERGMVPILNVDPASGTTSRTGETILGPAGQPLMAEGYKVLLIIEDYPGGPAYVAVLS